MLKALTMDLGDRVGELMLSEDGHMWILAEGLDVAIYTHADILLQAIEWYDVEDGVYDCWTDDGTPVLLTLDPDKRIHLAYGEPRADAEALATRLRELLQSVDPTATTPTSHSLQELVDEALKRADVDR
jgi:hypothetical protein